MIASAFIHIGDEPYRAATPTPGQWFMDRAKEITEFCLHNGGVCFPNCEVPTLFRYVFFHLIDRGVFVVREKGAITAVAFAWGMPEANIRLAYSEGKSPFSWKRSVDSADSIFLAEVIGDRKQLPKLERQVTNRWPDWRNKKMFTYRKKTLVELPLELIERTLHV